MVKKGLQASALVVANVLLLSACGGGGSSTDTVDSVSIVDDSSGTDDNSGTCDNPVTSLPTIFLEFNTSPNVTAVLSSDGCYVTVEANGKPNHTSSYWIQATKAGFMSSRKILSCLTNSVHQVTLKTILMYLH